MSRRLVGCWAFVVMGLVTLASGAQAQVAPAPRELLVLMTEEVRQSEGAPQVRAWWQRAGKPQWTDTDRALADNLKAHNALLAQPLQGSAPVSSVYREPFLAPVNAAALARVWGHRRVFTGAAIYEPVGQGLPFGVRGMRVELHLTLAGDALTQEQPLIVRRVAYATDGREAMLRARAEASEVMAYLMARRLAQLTGPVGVQREERLLVLRRASTEAMLEGIQRALLSVRGVESVQVRWVTTGHIALELNPGRVDPDSLIDEAAQALVATQFERFNVTRAQDPDLPQAELLLVTPRDAASVEP